MVPARVGAWVTASFGIVAMSLAALGVYGLVAFSVVQRTREIGVRKAIGAGTWDVVRLIIGENMLLTLTGLGAGMLIGVLGAQSAADIHRRRVADRRGHACSECRAGLREPR